MTDLKFTADHEWARVDGDIATIGITDYAQDQLGDLVYVELPETGLSVTAGQEVVVIESVKAAYLSTLDDQEQHKANDFLVRAMKGSDDEWISPAAGGRRSGLAPRADAVMRAKGMSQLQPPEQMS